jgi:hypothetical protein
MQLENKSADDIKYVAVEMSSNEDKEDITIGLFMGIGSLMDFSNEIIQAGEEFIWLSRGNQIHMLNLDQHSIDTLHIGESGSNNIISNYSLSTTQSASKEKLTGIHRLMKDAKRTLMGDLIDVDVYEVRDDIKEKVGKIRAESKPKSTIVTTPTKPKTNADRSEYGYYRSAAYGHAHTAGYSATRKKEISTTMFKRTTKYPISTAIESMRKKVEEIKQGSYKPPKLAKIPADGEEKEKESKALEASVNPEEIDNHMDEFYPFC